MLIWPQRYAAEAAQLGVRWPKGVLLHGPPGCGKTAAVYAVARECDAVVHLITAASIVGAYTGKAEQALLVCMLECHAEPAAGAAFPCSSAC